MHQPVKRVHQAIKPMHQPFEPLLSTIIAAFEAAHDLDATIPRLVPIATRRALGKGRRAKTGKVSAEEKSGASKGDDGEGATEAGIPA